MPKVSEEHKEQRRTNLLEAAAEVFIEHGFEKTTMKLVMDKAGVSRGGLYHYFDNKEDLFEAVIEEEQSDLIDGSIQTMIKQQDSYWDVLLMTFLGDDKEPDDEMDPLAPSKIEYFITGRTDKRRQESAQQRYIKAFEMTTKIIVEGEKAGEFTPRFDNQIIAKSIITYIDGLAVGHSLLDSKNIQLRAQTELLIEYLKWVLNVKQ